MNDNFPEGRTGTHTKHGSDVTSPAHEFQKKKKKTWEGTKEVVTVFSKKNHIFERLLESSPK